MRSRVLAAVGMSGLGAVGLVSACRSGGATAHHDGGVGTTVVPEPPPGTKVFTKCLRDEMRDALCIGFPGPHASVDTCPKSTTTTGANVYDMKHLQTTLPLEVPLDEAVTTRYRSYKVPGGGTSNSEVCCYSYCVAGLVKPTPPKIAGRTLCFDAPEAGTSLPADAPYGECPTGLVVGGEQTAFAADATSRTRAGEEAAPWIDNKHACCYFMDMGFLGRQFRPARDEAPRVADTAATDAWAHDLGELGLDSLSPELLDVLAARRIADAALEHASVASFARVSLQLLALGAPPELLRGAHQAALDEIEHASTMYGLASAYRGSARGPGMLDVSAPMQRTTARDRAASLASFARETLEDACIAETCGAIIARHCADAARDPALRRALDRIASDEARHAELAWQMLAWAVREGGAKIANDLRERLEALLRGGRHSAIAAPTALDAALADHGLLSRAEEARILEATLRDIVAPCATALLA
jgi:hypothetical protein